MEADVVPHRDLKGLRAADGVGSEARPDAHAVDPLVRIDRPSVDNGVRLQLVLPRTVEPELVDPGGHGPGDLLEQAVAAEANGQLTAWINLRLGMGGHLPVAVDEPPGQTCWQ